MRKLKEIKNNITITHPDVAAEWCYGLNGDFKPTMVSHGSNKYAWFECHKGKFPDGTPAKDHIWRTTVSKRCSLDRGCPFCVGQKVCLSNCLATTRPQVAAIWDYAKNGDMTPYNVTHGSKKMAWFKCYNGKWPDGSFADDHEWEAKISSTCKEVASPCKCCSGRKVVPSNCVATTRPDIAKLWHKTLNGDFTPYDTTAGSSRFAWVKCDKYDDHVWRATLLNLKNDRGCPYCVPTVRSF